MSGWEAFALISVALAGPGGFLVALVSSRRTRQVTEKVAESVGQLNGHGDLQEQGAAMLRELQSLRLTMQSSVDNQSATLAHLKQLDREMAESKDRLTALELWQEKFGAYVGGATVEGEML